jgi:hypothetical protein
MTISAAVASWLSFYEAMEVDTNHIKDGSDQFGLFKSPTRTTKEYNNGSCEITEFYQFYARQASVSEEDRKDSDAWLEDLAYWADDFPFEYAYPALDGNRKINKIELTGIPYPMEASSSDTLYQMSLAITYTREREV